MKKIIELDKATIKRFIEKGDNCDGNFVLLVDAEEASYRVAWMRKNGECRKAESDWVFGIPALDPDGSGRASEDAEWFLENASEVTESMGEIEAIMDAEDWSYVEFCENRYPEEWAEIRRESLDWLADEWIESMVEKWSDLPEGAEIPFTFEWKADPNERLCNCGSGESWVQCGSGSPYCG